MEQETNTTLIEFKLAQTIYIFLWAYMIPLAAYISYIMSGYKIQEMLQVSEFSIGAAAIFAIAYINLFNKKVLTMVKDSNSQKKYI